MTDRCLLTPHKGSNSDGRDVKNNSVNLLISNSAGAVNRTGIRYLHQLDKKARRPGAHDDTVYDTDHRSKTSYFTHHLVRLGVACLRAQAAVMQALSAAVRRRAAESQQELVAQYGRAADDRRVVPASDISLGSGSGDDGVEELAATVAPVTDSPPPVSPASASAVHFISSAGSSSWA